MIFQEYSNFYNLLYADKNYIKESDYILKKIKEIFAKDLSQLSILDVGCGTGKHLKYLSAYFRRAVGIDPSKSMIKIAKSELSNKNINFKIASGQDFKLKYQVDVITSMFHVFSYQTTKKDLNLYLENIYKHLNVNGIFIFDFWYEDGVINIKPELRVKKIEDKNLKITRISTPLHDEENKTVEVFFDIFVQNKNTNKLKHIEENHKMKYFNTLEVEKTLNDIGFKILNFEELVTGNSPNKNTWAVSCIAKK